MKRLVARHEINTLVDFDTDCDEIALLVKTMLSESTAQGGKLSGSSAGRKFYLRLHTPGPFSPTGVGTIERLDNNRSRVTLQFRIPTIAYIYSIAFVCISTIATIAQVAASIGLRFGGFLLFAIIVMYPMVADSISEAIENAAEATEYFFSLLKKWSI